MEVREGRRGKDVGVIFCFKPTLSFQQELFSKLNIICKTTANNFELVDILRPSSYMNNLFQGEPDRNSQEMHAAIKCPSLKKVNMELSHFSHHMLGCTAVDFMITVVLCSTQTD